MSGSRPAELEPGIYSNLHSYDFFLEDLSYEDYCDKTLLLCKYEGFGHSKFAQSGRDHFHPTKNGTNRVFIHTLHQKKK